MTFQDAIAGTMTIILLLAIIAFTMMEIAIPEVLIGAFGVAVGWVFSRGINGVNGALKRRLNNGDGKDAAGS